MKSRVRSRELGMTDYVEIREVMITFMKKYPDVYEEVFEEMKSVFNKESGAEYIASLNALASDVSNRIEHCCENGEPIDRKTEAMGSLLKFMSDFLDCRNGKDSDNDEK